MAPYHTVKEGDYLIKIAKEYGFDDYRIIWNHPQNVELKIKRKSANGLFPGDSLFVPEKEEDKAYYGTGRHHVIQLGPEPNILRIVLKNVDGDPIANTECTLRSRWRDLPSHHQ